MPIPLIPAIGYGLLGTGAATLGGARLFKDEFNVAEEDAAIQELNEGTRKGFDPNRVGQDGEAGGIKRGLLQWAGDKILDRDPIAIEKRTRELHIEKLKRDFKIDALNARLKALDQPLIEVTAGTKAEDLKTKVDQVKYAVPELESIKASGGSIEGLGVDTNRGTLGSEVQRAATNRDRQDYVTSPEYLDMKAQQNLTNQLAIGQMALANQNSANQMAIAQMNNQLQMRREDRASARDDRRDRQQMIMMLMKGLGQMGQGFAI